MANHAKDFSPVTLEYLTNGAPIIMGGYLGKEEAWVPSDIIPVSGRSYLKLSKSCAKFRSLCGTMLRFDKYLDGLMEKRDVQVKRVMKDLAEANNPLGHFGFRKTVARDVVAGGAAPENIQVSLPASEDSGPVNATVLFTYDPKCCVAVLLEPNILDHIVKSIRDGLDERGHRGTKRPLEERVKFDGMPEVRWNYTRIAAYVKYKDADNVEHTRHLKVDEHPSMGVEEINEKRQKAAEELHAFYLANNYPLASNMEGPAN